jgi:hypothetical protein
MTTTMNADQVDLTALRGLVATANLTGTVFGQTADCTLRLALHNAEHGLTQIEYATFPCQLVEAGRDSILGHALQQNYDYVLMYDGDATFNADALLRLLHTAYVTHPQADVVGAYAQLKGSFIPTIDTGTGTWEPHFPGAGILPVIRTGGHFLLIKTPILRRMPAPWFRTRPAMRPIRALAEVDNYARVKMDGENPFSASEAWERLVALARAESPQESSVGEDSGFCDAVKAAGGQIVVNTDVLTGHIEQRVITPADLKAKLKERADHLRLAVGVLP